MTDSLDSPAIRFCWCPPMEDPDDPDQHETACAWAAFVEQMQHHRGDDMTDTGIQACFCPPMNDPSDPGQHEAGCLMQTVILNRRFLDANNLIPVAGMLIDRNHAFPFHIPRSRHGLPQTSIPGGCYEASFGWVHVKPGCHCTRRGAS